MEGGNVNPLLAEERQRGSFDVALMTDFLNGDRAQTLRRRWFFNSHAGVESFTHAEKPREEQITWSVEHFMKVHQAHLGNFIPKDLDYQHMADSRLSNTGGLTINFGVFASTLRSHCSDDQKEWWLERAQRGEIIGCYMQTENAHGSNVRGLRTTATYLAESEEWEIHTPDDSALKWWSTGLPAIVGGQNMGLQMFCVQLRDEQLRVIPGIELGDVGAMAGENDVAIGFCRFDKLRVPRRSLLEKRVHVTKDGQWGTGPLPGSMRPQNATGEAVQEKKAPVDPKMAQALKYVTMMKTRIALASTAAGVLAKACTIAARYSCVREQGFVDGSSAKEHKVLDYSVQLYRVAKWIAHAYCYKGTTTWLVRKRRSIQSGGEVNLDDLPELHAIGSGLKAETTVVAALGMEDLRKCCGGHGYLMSAGIAPLLADFLGPNVTGEGDPILLNLQTARYLIKNYKAARRGETLHGLSECLNLLADPDFDPVLDARETLGLDGALRKEDLFEPAYLVRLFKWRSLVTISRAVKRYEALERSGLSQTQARNKAARLLSTATKCHVRYFCIQKFAELIEAEQNRPVKAALAKLCCLYGVSDLLEGEMWTFAPFDLDSIEDACATICDQLRPDIIPLTDAFEFPDRILNSTIGRYDGNVYSALYNAAKVSTLNVNADGSPKTDQKYLKALKPYLDTDFLKNGSKTMTSKL